MRKYLFIFIALISCIASARAQTANEILAKVTSVCGGCRTYSDEGTTRTEMGIGRRHSYFRSAFVRPGNFRFQLWINSDKAGSSNPWVVWKNGDIIQSQGVSSSAGVHNLRFDTALSRLAAFSAGPSVVVPQLLLPDAFRAVQLFSLIVDPNVAGEEKINGRQSFRMSLRSRRQHKASGERAKRA